MVATALAEAEEREKLAAADGDAAANGEDTDINDGKGKEPSASTTPPNNPATVPERNEASKADGEKTSMVAVKLASAIEYLNTEWLSKVAVGEITPPTPTGQPEAKIGPGEGPGAFETNENSPTPGVQSEAVGQASTGVIPMKSGNDVASPGQTNTGTATETDMNTPPGGGESWKDKDVLKQAAAALLKKTAASKQVARVFNIIKEADVPPQATEAGEGVPALPGPAASQEKLIDSIDAAINYTKRDAKAEPKERMGEVLSEPAQKKTTDTVLQNNLSNTTEAGTKISSVKVAAARAYLKKIAEEGCKPDASPEAKEKADKLRSAVEAKQEKSSQFDSVKETA
jgi:hypothetical protein